MANITQEYVLEVTSKGLKEIVREIKALRKDLGGLTSSTTAAEKGFKKVSKSAGEYDRNQKGAANATNNSTKAFSKMSQGMQGTLVPAYATVAANVFALTAAFGALERAADTQILIKASEELAVQTGRNLTTVAKSMQEITNGAISMKEGLTQASLAASAGFDNRTIDELTQVAKNASIALGRDLTDSMNRVFKGAIKAEPELLDELGIILRLDPAARAYAASIGKAVSELTTFEKQQAVVNAVLEQGQQKFGKFADVDVNPYTKLSATFNNLVTSILSFVNTGLGPIINTLAENIGLLTGGFLIFANTVAQRALPILQEMGLFMKEELAVRVAEFFQTLERGRAGEQFFSGVSDDIKNMEDAFKATASTVSVALEEVGENLPEGLTDRLTTLLSEEDPEKQADNIAKAYEATDTAMDRLNATLDTSSVEYAKQATAINVARGALDSYSKGQEKVNNQNTLLSRSLAIVNTAFKSVKATVETTKFSIVSGFIAGTNDGLLKLIPNIKTFNTLLTQTGLKSNLAGKSLRVLALSAFTLSGAVGGLIKAIPYIGQAIIAWELLSGAVTFVLDKFRDNEVIEQTNKALEDQSTVLKNAEKSLKMYNKELKNTPKTITNLNDAYELQKNVLTELNSANETLLENSQGFGEFFGSDTEELTNNLNTQLDILKEFGNLDEVNDFLEKFGENGKIVEENAVNAAQALPKLTNELLKVGEAADSLNNKLTTAFEAVNKSTQSIIDGLPKLSSVQTAYIDVSNAMETLGKASKDNAITAASALSELLDARTLGMAGLRNEAYEIDQIIASTKELNTVYLEQKARLDEINEALSTRNRNSAAGRAILLEEKTIIEESIATSEDLFNRQEERLQSLADTAKAKFKEYLESLNNVIYAQESLARQTRSIDFKLNLPNIQSGEKLGLETEKATKELESLYTVQNLMTKAIDASTDSLTAYERRTLSIYNKAKEGNASIQEAWSKTPGFMETVRIAQEKEASNAQRNIQLTLLQIETDKKAYGIREALLSKYYNEYQIALNKFSESSRDPLPGEASPEEILEKVKPLLKEVLQSQTDLGMSTEEYNNHVLQLWQNWGKLNYLMQSNNKLTLSGLNQQITSIRDKIKALGDESNYYKEGITDVEERIDKEQLLANAVLERIKKQFEAELKVQESAASPDETLVKKYKSIIATIGEVQTANQDLGKALIDSIISKENIALKLATDRNAAEMKGALRVSKVQQARLDYGYEYAKLQKSIGDYTSEEVKQNIELLNLKKKQAIQEGIRLDLSNATDEISRFSDIMQELNDRLQGDDLSAFEKQMAGLAAMNKIAAESGSEAGQAFSALGIAAVEYGKILEATGTDKFAATTQFASQAMGALAGAMDENSQAAKTLQFAQSALAVVEAVRAVIRQGTEGDPYTAFARMATMAAAVATLLSQANIAFSGGGGGGADAQAQAQAYQDSFGDNRITGNNLQTNALGDSLDNLATISDALYGSQVELRKSIVSLKNSFDAIGKQTFNVGGSFDAGDLSTNFGVSFGTEVDSGFFRAVTTTEELLASGLELGSTIKFVAGDFATKVTDASLFITKQITESDPGFFGFGAGTDVDIKTKFFGVNDALSQALSDGLEGSFDVVKNLFETFGLNIKDYFDGYELELDTSQLNLSGLSATEQAEVLSAYFSGVVNEVLKDTVPWLEKYRKAGEEVIDTLIRLTENSIILNDSLAILRTSVQDLASPEADTSRSAYRTYKQLRREELDFLNDQQDSIKLLNKKLTGNIILSREGMISLVKEFDLTANTTKKATAKIVEILAGVGRHLDAKLDLTEFKAIRDYYIDYLNDIGKTIKNDTKLTYARFQKRVLDEATAAWITSLEEVTGWTAEQFGQAFTTFAEAVFPEDVIQSNLEKNARKAVRQNKNLLKGYLEDAFPDLYTELLKVKPADIDTRFIVGDIYEQLEAAGAFADETGQEMLHLLINMGLGFDQLLDVTDDAAKNFDDLIQSLTRSIALFGLTGKELDLLQHSFDFADALEEAEGSAEAIALTEQLYGLKRLEIIKGYHEEIVDALKEAYAGVDDAILNVIRGSEAFNEVAYESLKIESIKARLLKSFKTGSFLNDQEAFSEAMEALSNIDTSASENFNETLETFLNFSEEVPGTIAEQIDLANELKDSIMDRYAAEEASLDSLKQLSLDIKSFLDDLLVGELSPLTNLQRFNELYDRFNQDIIDITSGDQEAAQRAADGILDNASALLDLGSSLFAIGPRYQDLFRDVFTQLNAVGIDLEEKVVSETEILSQLQETTIKELYAVESILGILEAKETELFEQEIRDSAVQSTEQLVAISAKLDTLPDYTNILNIIESNTRALGGIVSRDIGAVDVPFDQLALIHQGEMIIPTEQAQMIREGNVTLGATNEGTTTLETSDIVNAIHVLTQVVAETQEELIDQNGKSINTTNNILNNNSRGTTIKTVGMV